MGFEILEEVKQYINEIDPTESLVGLFEVENEKGNYLIIGNKVSSHLWAVTDPELRELYELLKKRYD